MTCSSFVFICLWAFLYSRLDRVDLSFESISVTSFLASLLLITLHKMERFDTEYKNIPIPSKKQDKTQLISKVGKVIKRMRWKALKFLGKFNGNNYTESSRFQSIRCSPAVGEVSNFENDFLLMIKNIEFRKINNSFQEKLMT